MSLIKELAREHNLTQGELGRRLGYGKQRMSNISCGRVPVTPNLVVRVWQELGIESAKRLLPYVDQPLPQASPAELVGSK